jgi:diaminopimelate decarboxylase
VKTVLAEQAARGECRLTDKLERFLLARPETPILALDLEVIEAKYLAGPTCDSADILYEKSGYQLPLDLHCDDRIEILNTGAAVSFNGFPPLRTVCL